VEKFPRFAWDCVSKRNWLASGGRVSKEGQYVNNTRKEGERRELGYDKDWRVIASK
jgi:hypothetical protein